MNEILRRNKIENLLHYVFTDTNQKRNYYLYVNKIYVEWIYKLRN